jgi:DNA-binding NtrC family response regulator
LDETGSDKGRKQEAGTATVARAGSFVVRAAALRVVSSPSPADVGLTARVDREGSLRFVIGGGDAADLRLADPAVSREHLRVVLGPNGVRLLDDGSKNGTFLGAVRISDATLTEDAAVVLGGTTLAIAIEKDLVELPISYADRFGDAIGVSPAMRHLFAVLERAAVSDLPILIEGESGVGKDLLARAIHTRSQRADAPFVVLDCGSIAPTLVESELFGHERGAFTGADTARRGVFEEANGGTLFLDEIGELPLDLQPKLLRAIEQGEVKPVGGKAARAVDVRVVSATNRRLAEAARKEEFRSDLFYRLAVVRVTVPPLRERKEDVVPIARAILQTIRPGTELAPDLAVILEGHKWPGNVRELRNVVERWAVLGPEAGALFDDAEAVRASADDELAGLTFHEARKIVLDRFEEAYLPKVLARADGVVARAAELAGVARPSFYRMLERLPESARTPPKKSG